MKFTASAFVSALAWVASVAALPKSGSAAKVSAAAGPAGFNVTSLNLNGSGCPSGSSFYTLNSDRTAVTLGFSRYYAEVGPKIPASSNRKNCQLTVGVKVPAGFTFGLASVETRGWYQLESKVTASQQSIYYFQGQLSQATARSELIGPVNGAEYAYNDQFDLVSTVLAPCGANSVLIIQTELRASNSQNTKGFGYIATDSIRTNLEQKFNFQWQTCKE